MPAETAVRELREQAVRTSTLPADELEPFLSHDDAEVRHLAADICRDVGPEDPEHLRTLRPELVRLAADGRPSTRNSALAALLSLARAMPTALEADIDVFVAALRSDVPTTRLLAAQVVSTLTVADPAIPRDAVSRLLSTLEELDGDEHEIDADEMAADQQTRTAIREHVQTEQTRSAAAREITANVLVEVAEAYPATVGGHVDAVVPLLDDDNDEVVAAAIDVLASLGGHDVPVSDEAVDALTRTCHDGTRRQQARAVRALGFLEATRARPDIEEVAATTPHDDLRELAAQTATWLREREA